MKTNEIKVKDEKKPSFYSVKALGKHAETLKATGLISQSELDQIYVIQKSAGETYLEYYL